MMAFFILFLLITAVFAVSRLSTIHLNHLPATKAELGRQLFFDSLLSSTRKISCASCHKPEFAFADTVAVSVGVHGRTGTRNTPSSMNLSNASLFFWDGRAGTLEQQALMPVANPVEMDLPIDSAVRRLRENEYYNRAFIKLFNEKPSAKNLALALAGFERSLETSDTPFDDWKVNDNQHAISQSAQRGFVLFNGRANCTRCHFGADFSNHEFRNIGLFNGKEFNDSGRAAITKRSQDLGKFKIGPLRNIALTAPYMHNGMFKTLRDVIEYYNEPDRFVASAVNRDSLLSKPLNLSPQDKTDLENFLFSLTSRSLIPGTR